MSHLAWYFFYKCVREFGKVWAFARAEFGMGGTGICPSPLFVQLIVYSKWRITLCCAEDMLV